MSSNTTSAVSTDGDISQNEKKSNKGRHGAQKRTLSVQDDHRLAQDSQNVMGIRIIRANSNEENKDVINNRKKSGFNPLVSGVNVFQINEKSSAKRNKKTVGNTAMTDKNDKENVLNTNSSNIFLSSSSSLGLSQTKKLDMTDAEKAMDGAPQGEIFDVTVAYDENIAPSTNPDEEIKLALTCLGDTKAAWADKHSAIESMRRLMLHHSSDIINTPGCIAVIISAAVEAVASLRSSTSRNAILCLNQFIESYERFDISNEQLSVIITSLMNRTGTT